MTTGHFHTVEWEIASPEYSTWRFCHCGAVSYAKAWRDTIQIAYQQSAGEFQRWLENVVARRVNLNAFPEVEGFVIRWARANSQLRNISRELVQWEGKHQEGVPVGPHVHSFSRKFLEHEMCSCGFIKFKRRWMSLQDAYADSMKHSGDLWSYVWQVMDGSRGVDLFHESTVIQMARASGRGEFDNYLNGRWMGQHMHYVPATPDVVGVLTITAAELIELKYRSEGLGTHGRNRYRTDDGRYFEATERGTTYVLDGYVLGKAPGVNATQNSDGSITYRSGDISTTPSHNKESNVNFTITAAEIKAGVVGQIKDADKGNVILWESEPVSEPIKDENGKVIKSAMSAALELAEAKLSEVKNALFA